MSFKVLKAGPLTTIQDAGRTGQSHLGLSQGGPMDYRSFVIANKLVSNDNHAAALEITLGGLQMQCLESTNIALTGAFCPLFINGKAKANWQSHLVNKGDVVKVDFAALGVRAYLAFGGGIDSPTWFASQAIVVRENMGQALANGDVLKLKESVTVKPKRLHFSEQPSLRDSATLDFVAGYQWQALKPEAQNSFLNTEYKVSAKSDRMGVQLTGEAIETGIKQIYSEGIATGSIQITGAGTPILLMRDAQTIGGYPKLGSITSASQDALAQLRQGATIKFSLISPERSIELLREYHQKLDQLSF